ncbi:actin cytoskeleton-regulatory complex protein PAN1-like isoform X3 [Telopea speciosissima]|uniref:actin cytoskeleton-regulatory complex protein PAN1-like isoform X2 n=1 Tax=Telopea speciosissima TaxID=54955 RepID=UPI001CC7A4A9|nr:actin cytoskeleton-regulatory complex protein PAN1-like isoform X2 [Telopea speciosissima]XP_043712720.1 actin cytoskeleton-regulatory complex protein PAN1-like isoform X3 [Telopea speciosissima]
MAGQNVDLFDLYFRRADLDQDGRISGNEAVSFFQGANLPKHVLAQIWMHADQNRTGYLGRAEFYNALKLVTVAQSKRELTPDIVKAALYGPAAAKIPAPQINLPATPSSQPSPITAAPAHLMGALAPTTSQNPGFRGPQVYPNANMNPQFRPSQDNQFMRPPQAMPAGVASLPSQGISGQVLPGGGSVVGPRPPNSSISTDWLGGRTGGSSMGATSQIPNRGTSPTAAQDGFGLGSLGLTSSVPPRPQASSGITSSVTSTPQDPVLSSLQSTAKDSKALVASANGFASDSIFGVGMFTATASQPKQAAATPSFSANSAAVSSAMVPVSSGPQSSVKLDPLGSLSSLPNQSTGGQLQRVQSLVKPNLQVSDQNATAFTSSGISVGPANPAPSQSQPPWPKMTLSDIQNYTKVFVEVDTDRDGKITGEQARNLFLSWRLPREVLKQVWELSDQDNDSMLSLREFCTALYLMERYREGRPLPAVLPSSVMYDETLMRTTGPAAAYGGHASWRPTSGLPQQHGMPGARPVSSAAGVRPPLQVPVSPRADGVMQPNQQKSRVPVLEKHLVNQLSKEEQDSLNSKFQEATEADKKVEELEKEIMDYKEKTEFYRNKMQELVLYKSRCDNRLNEITERASGDKREVESLAKKYEEKYKQVGDIASKLTIEEATFRDIQERKMELYQAIVKMEQGGSADGILQVRADRIQSDLEELVKGLNERCKKYGLRVKPTALVELPFGWQPGIQEAAADWNEDWDKFEDEGFSFVKELTLDVQNVVAPPKPKPSSVRKEKDSSDEGLTTASSPNADTKSEKPMSTVDRNGENGSAYAQSEDGSARSAPASPTGRSTVESPSHHFGDNHFAKSIGADGSPHAKETESDHGGAESILSGDKSFDEPTWGTFDTNYDTDSVWGFGTSRPNDLDNESHTENSFFSGGGGLNPIRTGSPQADSMFQRRSPFNFADSVPSSPLFNSGFSPRYNEGSEGHSFDNFSRFDSFNSSIHDSSFFPPRETLTRFDSIRSTADFDHSRGFPSFDDADPFGSSGPFKSSSESQTPKRGSDNWSAF